MELSNYKQLYVLMALIALLFTITVHPFLPHWFNKYKATVKEDLQSIPNPEVVYHDFDHDGYSEKAALKFQENINESALKIYAYNQGLVDQWTFGEHWLPHSMIFGDYDQDGHDEVYVFTKNQDSLFIYAIDPQKVHQFVLRRIFIIKAPTNVHGWDIGPIAGTFFDSDGDGFQDLIFNVMAGHALQPRRLFCFSIKKKKLIFQSPKSYSFLACPNLVHQNNTAKILMKGSVSLTNAPKDASYSDYSAWLTAFDCTLHFTFPPIPFKGRNTELNAFAFGEENDRIVGLVNYGSKAREYAELILFNWRGQKLRQKELKGRGWNLIQYLEHGRKQTVLLNTDQGIWGVLNDHLEFSSNRIDVKGLQKNFVQAFDLDNDFEKELIFHKNNVFTIVRSDFTHPVSLSCPGLHSGRLQISLRKNGESNPELSIQGGEKKFLVQYAYNPLFPFRIVSHAVIFILFFMILFAIVFLFNMIKGYRYVLIALLKNPERGILIFNAAKKIRFMNHTMINQFQLGLTDLRGQSINQTFRDFPAVHEFLQKLITSKTKIKKELYVKENGIDLKGEIYGKPVLALFHLPQGFYVEINDYSRPLEVDRLKTWSKTVQRMAHEIKAPLSSIAVNLMTINLKLEESAPETYRQIKPELTLLLNEVERVKEKTINFLKFTNLEALRFSWVNVKEIIDQTVKLFDSYAQKSVNFLVEIGPEVDRIYADEKQLQMALQAIIENAIDAIKAKGSIAISVNKTNHVDKQFKEFLEIDVADTGPGIAPELVGKVFEPYFTTKKEGTGMGLAIAQKIVLEHHGELKIISSEHFSTVVKIILPLDGQSLLA